MTASEKYLNPKEISDELCKEHHVCLSEDYIRAIRQECERRNDGVFVARLARISDILKFLAANPRFTRRRARAKASAGFSV